MAASSFDARTHVVPSDAASPAAPRAAARFPLPGLLLLVLVVAVVHGPLLVLEPGFDEGPFLSGDAQSRGAAIGMAWLPIEVELLGASATPHRVLAFLVELALAGVVAVALRRTPHNNWALLALAAYLVHPWRTESFVRLGARPILVSELGVAIAVAAAAFAAAQRGAARVVTTATASIATAAATSGMPLVALFPLSFFLRSGGRRSATAIVWTLAAVAGVAIGFRALPTAAPSGTSWTAFELLARPWRTGLVHGAHLGWGAAGASAFLLLLGVVAWRRRDAPTAVLLLSAVVAWVAAPGLRPPRTGLEYLGAGMTPEGWLPFLALLAAACWRTVAAAGWSKAPLLAFAAVAVVGGRGRAALFHDDIALLDQAIASEPDQVELQILRGQIDLAQFRAAAPGEAHDFARAALATARRAQQLGPGDAASLTLEVMALALLGQLDVARGASDRLLASYPEDWRARAARGELEAIAGDPFTALRWMRSAVAAHPVDHLRAGAMRLVDAIYAEIRGLLADHRYGEARTACERLIAVAPEELEARLLRVDTFTLAGEIVSALNEAMRLHVERPRDSALVQRIASLHERLGHREEANRFQQLLRSLAAASTNQ